MNIFIEWFGNRHLCYWCPECCDNYWWGAFVVSLWGSTVLWSGDADSPERRETQSRWPLRHNLVWSEILRNLQWEPRIFMWLPLLTIVRKELSSHNITQQLAHRQSAGYRGIGVILHDSRQLVKDLVESVVLRGLPIHRPEHNPQNGQAIGMHGCLAHRLIYGVLMNDVHFHVIALEVDGMFRSLGLPRSPMEVDTLGLEIPGQETAINRGPLATSSLRYHHVGYPNLKLVHKHVMLFDSFPPVCPLLVITKGVCNGWS